MTKREQQQFKELARLCRQAPKAMLLLKRVTGKFGSKNVSPFDEKKWSKSCWKAYLVLRGIEAIVCYGKFRQEVESEFLEEFVKHVGSPFLFIGTHATAKWDKDESDRTFDPVQAKRPDLTAKSKKLKV